MQPSPFLHIQKDPDHPGQCLVYALPRAALLRFPDQAVEALKAGNIPPDKAEQLLQLGLLVQNQEAGRQQGLTYIDEVNQVNPALRMAVILNLECNFACRYCYEGNMKGKIHMTDQVADNLIDYLKKRFTPQKNKMTLDFYGGEPLLSVERIKYICGPLKEFVEARGAAFEATLVTNGSLLTPSRVRELQPFGVTRARLTLDGPPDIHDTFRPFKNGRPSFETIIKNMQDVCDQIQLAVGGNYTEENFRRFTELLDILEAKGLGPDKIMRVKFTHVTQTTDQFALADFNEGCGASDEPWLTEASLFLREEILRRGYRTTKLMPSPCMIDIDDSFTIHYDGDIYKCTALIGHKEYVVGNVSEGMGEYSETYALNNWKENEECLSCKYLPLCFGGCRYAKMQNTGTLQGVDCMKNYHAATLNRMIVQEARYPKGIR